MYRLRYLMQKEFRQLRRSPEMLRLLFLAPVVQVIMFGYAATTDVKHVSLAVYDGDRSARSRELLTTLEKVGSFDLDLNVARPALLLTRLDRGQAQLTLEIPQGFARDLARGRPVTLQVLADGSDSNTATVALGYLLAAVQDFGARLRVHPPLLQSATRVWYNPELRSANFMVPGVIANILLIVTTSLTALAIVREREMGTLEQLLVTPIRPMELMLGKMLPFVFIGLIDILFILGVACFWFRIPLEGSLLLLFVMAGGFLLNTLGLGLFISTVSRTQQQALMTALFLLMPSILLSGFIFPIANMPRPMQLVSYGIAMRYFLEIIRGIFLKGNGLEVLWPQAIALMVLGILTLALSAAHFRKRIE
ncbi:MAG TPA: ABC transporter permease [Armatimonadetes bacterium]|nr:ABC transporter permease [Armatimonadota bacterium]